MTSSVAALVVLGCCALAIVTASQDHVLRFLSREQSAQEAKAAQRQGSASILHQLLTKQDQLTEEFRVQGSVCPNGITQCSESSTCCPLHNGDYGCCDGVNAECCGDGKHCCPEGYRCDLEHGQCTSLTLDLSFPWHHHKLVRAEPVVSLAANNTCKDNKTVCELNDTCCNATHGFGCCPILHAVCCSDRLHCCPARTQCDMVHKRCFGEDWEEPWLEKRQPQSEGRADVSVTPVPLSAGERGVTCDDGLMCPDGNTCCKMLDGSYGCCCYPDAVCCSDHIHCCPHDYTCDIAKQGCVSNWIVHKWSKIVRPKGPDWQVGAADAFGLTSVVCPGGTSQCPDGETCCLLSSGQYGCCPFPDATCCSDGVHCCPNGYTCDVQTGSCAKDNGLTVVPWATKTAATPRVSTVVCPDGASECPDGSTCCKQSTGQYGCCPLPQAVCCSDGVHCCPNGYTCDVQAGTCTKAKGEAVVPWATKTAATARVSSVVCPGGEVECPDASTCCMLASGQYGCCPVPNATCCSDHIHCCPSGYTCDVQAGSCNKDNGETVVPWATKTAATPRLTVVVCPGGQVTCPDDNTCCKMSSGDYGCCPRSNAVCCSDGVHCCPQNTTCNLQAGTCDTTNRETFLPWATKTAATARFGNIVCPDGKSECPDGQTCCQLSGGQYACCPQPKAVCCADHLHCCPEGYTCETSKGECQKGHLSLPWQEKQPARPRLN